MVSNYLQLSILDTKVHAPEFNIWGQINFLQHFSCFSWESIQPAISRQSQKARFLIRWLGEHIPLSQYIRWKKKNLVTTMLRDMWFISISFYTLEGFDTAEHLQISPALPSGATCIKLGEPNEHWKQKSLKITLSLRANVLCSELYWLF